MSLSLLVLLLCLQKPCSIPEHFVENVHSALRLISMPTQDDELDCFWAGSPPEVQRSSSVDGAKKRKKKSAPKFEGLRVVQVRA